MPWALIALRVHAGGEDVADDLLDAGGIGLRRGLFGQLALHRLGAFGQHLERAPRRAVARNGVRGEPLAVDVAAEVDARILADIEIANGEAVHRRQLALVELERGVGRRNGGIRRLGGVFLFRAAAEDGGDGKGQQQGLRLLEGYELHGHKRTPARQKGTPAGAIAYVSDVPGRGRV